MSKTQAEQYKGQGNECIKGGNHAEAIINYTQAVKLDPHNHLLYSNRSLAFLKMQQYYLALEDAKETIKLQPSWPKGYFRKGEVEFGAKSYLEALISYRQALLLDPSDQCIREAISRTAKELSNVRKAEARQPWIFTGVGIILGLAIVIADQFLTKEPSIQHISLELLLIIVFGAAGYALHKAYSFMQSTQNSSLLEKPIDLLSEMGNNTGKHADSAEEQTSEKKHQRKGGVSAARQRYRKGKT